MADKKKIDPELNRARVKATMAKRDRINIILPEGTNDRIDALGFKRSDFAKNANFNGIRQIRKDEKINTNFLDNY